MNTKNKNIKDRFLFVFNFHQDGIFSSHFLSIFHFYCVCSSSTLFTFYNCTHKYFARSEHKQFIFTIYLLIFHLFALFSPFSFPFLILMVLRFVPRLVRVHVVHSLSLLFSPSYCWFMCVAIVYNHFKHTIIIILNGKQFT